jgi:lysophospholipase L1-like esterase
VVVLVGINNLAGGFTVEQTVAGVRAVTGSIKNALPDARVVLLAVLPARPDPKDPLREKITETNRQLQTFAETDGVVFHDAGSVLLEADGTITTSTLRDFIHPTHDGYARLSDSIAPVLAKVLGG